MSEQTLLIDGVRAPRFFYGTAWKEDRTGPLTELAIRQGFRAIDTANQRRHYHEAAVGQAVRAALDAGVVSRDELFLQTKYTFQAGQDHRLPYDPSASIAAQVEQSFASSLEHLGVTAIDSYVLHGPNQREGLTDDDWSAWRAIEEIHDSGGARLIGVSNFTLDQLNALYDGARVQPRFMQNRCYAVTGWDRQIRRFCAVNDIVYQGFSLLTANQAALSQPHWAEIAKRHDRSVAQIAFRFALQSGVVPLTGTTQADHMQADLDIFSFSLAEEEMAQLEQ